MTVEMNTNVTSPKLRENTSSAFSSRTKRFSMPLLPTMEHEELKPKRGRIFSLTSKEIRRPTLKEESYYFSAEIVDEDLLENLDTGDSSEAGSSADSGVENIYNVATCTPILTPQVCEIQRRLGLEGGTLDLPDCNMSLHILSNEYNSAKTSQTSSVMGASFKPISFVKKLLHRPHNSLMKSQDLTDYDSRISFSHTTPPDWLNNSYQMVAGGMARIDFGNARVLQNNAILQLNLTLNHKSIHNNDNEGTWKTSCVISNTPVGPFTEIDSNCCRFYNGTAQITLCHTMVRKLAGTRKSIYIAPIIKLYPCPSPNLFDINLCVTDLVIRVGIYGEEFFRDITRCSVVISRSNAVDPVKREYLNQQSKVLHLWCSFSLSFNAIQDLHISIESNHLGIETSNNCIQSQNSIFVSADDIAKRCNISNSFALHRHRIATNEHFISPSPTKAKTCNNLVIFINALSDGIAHKLNIKTPGLAPNLRASSPIRRWKNIQGRPMNFITKRPPTQSKIFESIWFDVDETEAKFKPTQTCPNANRKLMVSSKAAVIRYVKDINKSHPQKHIKSGHVAPILGSGLVANTSKATQTHQIVLVGDKIVSMGPDHGYIMPEKIDYETHKNVDTIVSILSRQFYALPDLSCDISSMINLLLNQVNDWKMFSELVGFRPDFIEKVLSFVNSKPHITIIDLKLIYLRKFVKFCGNERTFLTEVVRACLLMEEYNLMEEILLHISIKYVSGFFSQHDESYNKVHQLLSSFPSLCKDTLKRGGYDPTVSEEYCRCILQLPQSAINVKQRILFQSFVNNILIIIYSCQALGKYSTRL